MRKKVAELKDKLLKLTDKNVKERFAALVTETEKVVEDHEVTQEKANQQLDLVEKAIKEVDDAIKKESEKQENTPKPLPTYTNGVGNYKLAEEIGNIIVYMRKNGASADVIAPIKSKYDALNEKLGLADEDGVLSAEDFATATANLTAARDAVEKFMEGKVVVPSVRSVEPNVLNRTERAAERASGKGIETTDYASKRGYFFESGQNNSPYAKYSYVFYSKGVVASAYYEGGDIPEAYKKFHITARPTDTGIAWKIVVNENHETLDANKVYFTLPEGHNVKAGSVTVQAFNKNGLSAIERPSVTSGDQIVEALSKAFSNIPDWHALHGAGLKNVRKGTKDNTNAVPMTTSSASNTGAKNFKVNTLNLLGRESTQGLAGLTDRGFYNRNVAIETDSNMQRYSDEKFAKISSKVRDVYTFELGPQDERSYVISFETTGSNDMKNLTYAGGLKYVKGYNRILVNHWVARTDRETDNADKITVKARGNGTFLVEENRYTAIDYGNQPGLFGGDTYAASVANNPKAAKGVIITGNYTEKKIDTTSYLEFPGYSNPEKAKLFANNLAGNGGEGVVYTWTVDGKEYDNKAITRIIANRPGVTDYMVKGWFKSDNSSFTIPVTFVVKPKTPNIRTDLTRRAGVVTNIEVDNVSEGETVYLYKKEGNNLIPVRDSSQRPISKQVGKNGVATFENMKLEPGEYVAKSSVEGNWQDYNGNDQTEVVSDPSENKIATDGAPPVVRMVGSADPLPDTRPADNAPAIYEVTQGERFAPRLEAFDNLGVIKKFELENNFPAPLMRPFRESNSFSEANSYEPRFNGNIPANTAPGVYTRTITVSDGVTGDKTYYFKYKVLPVAPTVNNTTNENRVLSTDKTLTGRGIAGARITVKVADKVVKTTTVKSDGTWEVRLGKGLNSNSASHVGQLVDADSVKVTQTVSNAESRETNVTVAVGESKIQPSVAGETSVYAGAKKIVASVPHDTGIFYVKYTDKTTNTEKEIAFKRETINGNWTSNHEDYAVITGTPTKDNFVENVTFEMKESVKEGTAVKIIANIKERGYSSPTGWKETPVTNEQPTLAANYTGNKQVVEFGSTFDPKTLVRVSDKEDDKQLTRGNGTQVEVISVNGNTGVKTVNTNETGTYTVKLKATDSQGKQSDEITVTAEVTKNHQAVAKPIINLKQGENLSADEKRSLIELTKGNGKEALPSDARVEVTLATDSPGDKTATAKVTFKDGTVRNVDVRYKVHKTFETVTRVYDFAGEGRNDSLLSYYLNPGGLTPGMSWVIKKANETEFKDANTKLIDMLKGDGVGTTAYNFGAKYSVGRFTDSPSEAERLSYTPTFTHEVFDVSANITRVVANHGTSLTASQAQAAVSKTNNSANLPAGTTYEWVKSETDATALTDAEKNVTEFGEITRYVKVTLPKVSETGPNANQVQKYKIIPVTLKVNETVKPVVKLVGDDGQDITLTEGTADANLPKVTVYRGEKSNVTIKASDNTGKIQELRGNGMPNGIWFNKDPQASREVWLSSDTATETNPLSHTITGVVETGNRIEEKIVTVIAKDKTNPTNVTTVKFKMVVKEQKEKYTPTAPTNAVNFNSLGTSVTSAEDVKKITDLVNVPDLSAEATNAGGVRKALKNNGEITTENGKKVVTVTVTYPDRSTDEVTVPVAQNYNVVARPIINFKRGEVLNDED